MKTSYFPSWEERREINECDRKMGLSLSHHVWTILYITIQFLPGGERDDDYQ
jgi:hypothetical protein